MSYALTEFGLIRVVKLIHVFTLNVLKISLGWPIFLFKDSSYREEVVECGRIMIPFGYLMAMMMTGIYPKAWLWFIGGIITWKLLEHYHQKSLPKLTQTRE